MKSSGNSSAPGPSNPSGPRSGPDFGSAPSRKRFALTDRSRTYDPTTTAARSDIADVRLAERIFAPHYAAPMPRAVLIDATLTANPDGGEIGQVLTGDIFEVLEITAAHAWGVAQSSGRVGYLPLAAFGAA